MALQAYIKNSIGILKSQVRLKLPYKIALPIMMEKRELPRKVL